MKKIIFITGSTDGIGKLAATKLAKEGHQVYIHGRNREKLDRVISEIKKVSHNEAIDGYVADFSSLEAVRDLATRIKQELPRIDVLINNAGVFQGPVSLTPEGLDIRFAVNYLAPYVLTEYLTPLLEKGEGTRVINLSSAAQAPVSLEALTGTAQLSVQEAYAQSKLALTMWSFYKAMNNDAIAIIAVNPGSLLNTNMVREAYGHHWSSADKGANILFDLAVSEAYKDITAMYFDNDRGDFGRAHPLAYDEIAIQQLIEKTEAILKNKEV
ncbi:SDR family NAD(P)-dependent oxidoreductase [Aureisphaera galaxeae]|uniref:SDR family NAD(P)-dependent oxidoreductase n=1 Tax=Aureisphaera galaxeae TaxID=1538023 RepID=UPI0023503146|nr:SDR family NAD(P)-dependent oxidoreductase [Aureisphaera galaxeae]MDC8004308.1 SDR family NAD(P)-dependent oxidoreductase [Aureisphaera galaxeae]